MGFEPMNTGFADQRVSHFAIGAHCCIYVQKAKTHPALGSGWVLSCFEALLLRFAQPHTAAP